MPFCSQCGKSVRDADRFCANCGAAQPIAGSAAYTAGFADRGNEALRNLNPRTAATLCYVPFVGWLAALLVLATQRFRLDRVVRFHAFQGLYLAVVWILLDWVFASIHWGWRFETVVNPLKLAIIGIWIYLLVQTNKGELVRLPFLGELADRSVDEQR